MSIHLLKTSHMLLLQVQGIILHQDGSGQLRMVDMETQMEVKRMLAAQGISHGQAGETMVVHVSYKMLKPVL